MTRTIGQAILAGASLAALAAVVACGGGGGGGGQSSLPGAMTQSHASFTVTIPSGAGTSSTQRAPAFVSPNTQSITIALTSGTAATTTANLTPASPNCTPANGSTPLTCTVGVTAPAGTDTFAITMYQGLNGTGSVLSTATITAQISPTQVTVVPITLGGEVAGIVVSVTGGNNLIPGGYATTLPVIVTAKDASGAAIVGAGSYANPITLTNADTSGITTLSTSSVTSPSTTVTLAYAPNDANSGVLAVSGLPLGATTIGASATGVPASAITAGTFQYIGDRFFGFGHTRMLSGPGAASTITYNNAGIVTGTTTYAYNVTDALTVHAGLTFNSVPVSSSHHVVTYAQTAPVTATPAEMDTRDEFRASTITPTGAIFYRYGQQDLAVNSGAINSPITGNVPGTTNITNTFPPTGAWEEDVLPHVTGAAWSNTDVPFTETYAGAEIATLQMMADNSWSFNETAPNTFVHNQTAAGTATNVDTVAGVTTATTIGLPGGGTIPVAQQETAPVLGATSFFNPPDWYPGGGAPVQPLYAYRFAGAMTAIPAPCNVPAAIATQAYAIVQINSLLDITSFRNRQAIWSDYYVPNGIGFVCETYVQTDSVYRFQTGTISSLTAINYTIGVPNVSSLSIGRSP